MSAKTKRDLSAIVDEIRVELKRDTAGIIKLGALLTEAKRQVKHGEWLLWLEENFSMSQATAQRYLQVHKFLKNRTVRDLEAAANLSASALYDLAGNKLDYFTPEAVQAIFDEAAEGKRIGGDRAWSIACGMHDAKAAAEAMKAEAQAKPQHEAGTENTVSFADAAEARWTETTAEQEADALADDAAPSDPDPIEGPEQFWQRSLANLAGDAVAMPAYWTREFGDWRKFKAPSDLVTLAKQAAKAWAELAESLESAERGEADKALAA